MLLLILEVKFVPRTVLHRVTALSLELLKAYVQTNKIIEPVYGVMVVLYLRHLRAARLRKATLWFFSESV